ncbi:MAG: hypothetical protein Q4C67_08220 [Deinococcus sp.]|nr:hypothetical protein [Deinococcus sp.]
MDQLRGHIGTRWTGQAVRLHWDGAALTGTLGGLNLGRLGTLMGTPLHLLRSRQAVSGTVGKPLAAGSGARLHVAGQLGPGSLAVQWSGGLPGALQAQQRHSLLEGELRLMPSSGESVCHLLLAESSAQLQGQVISPQGKATTLNLRGSGVPLSMAAVALACAYACWIEDHSAGGEGMDWDSSDSGDSSDGGGGDGGGGGE